MWLYSQAQSDLYYNLRSQYGVPGVNCEICGQWGGVRFRPIVCPWQIREEIEAIYSNNPSRPVAEWKAYVHRWETIIANETGNECLLTPGDLFQPMGFRIYQSAREAWYISYSAAVVSNEVADAIRISGITGIQLFGLEEFLQYEDIQLEIPLPPQKQRKKEDYGYLGVVAEQDNWTAIFDYKRFERCSLCGRERDTNGISYSDVCKEVAELRDGGRIWKEVIQPGLDIFIYQGDWVVSDRAHSVFQRFASSEVNIKPLIVV